MADLTASERRAYGARLDAAGDVVGAMTALREAVQVAAADLAEVHGMLGGVHKRAGDLLDAIHEYDVGGEIETRYGLASHYNRLNRLVTRILLQPGCLASADPFESLPAVRHVDVLGELEGVRASLAASTSRTERADRWALGDLAVASALTGHRRDMTSALRRFEALSPRTSERARYQETAAALAALGGPGLELSSDLAAAFGLPPASA